MMELVVYPAFLAVTGIVVGASVVWVYVDATRHKIGKIPNEKGLLNISAGAWAVCMMFFWVIVFPVYLINRTSLVENARHHPIEVSWRKGKIAALSVFSGWSVVAGLVSLVGIVGLVLSPIPRCDDSNTIATVGEVINEMPIAKESGAQFVSLKNIVEQGYNKQSEIRACSATLLSTFGEEPLRYNIKWQDKEKHEFYVEVRFPD